MIKYHKLVDVPTLLKLLGFSIEQFIAVLNLFIMFGNDPQQMVAKSVLLKIPNDLLVKHGEYCDELTEKIHQYLIQKKAQ